VLAYREAGESGGPVALLVHGYPNSSYLWRDVLPAVARAGWHAIAPDLPGFGDSPLGGRQGTWEDHIEALAEFVAERDLAPVALVLHDWGGLIGLRWACDNPGAACALVLMSTGFFPDGKWHGMADMMRTPGQGEEFVAGFERDAFGDLMRSQSAGFDDEAIASYWKAFETDAGRQGILDLYRSGDCAKFEPYRGKLAALEVPFLALWGGDDAFAPVAGAYRFQKEVPGAEVVVIEGAGHFVYDDEPERCAREIVDFLSASG
jgi:haloalkane dehalogenase